MSRSGQVFVFSGGGGRGRSGLPDGEEELAVAVGAGERGIHRAEHGRSGQRGGAGDDVGHDSGVHRGIADHTLAAIGLGFAGFELRLHQGDEHTTYAQQRPGGRQDRAEGNEGYVDDDRVELGARELLGAQLAGVDLLEVRHARVAAEFAVELRAADVDADHVRRAGLKRAVGEAAGGRADVEHVCAGEREAEVFERAGEFFAAAADEPRRLFELEREVDRVVLARFVEPLGAMANLARADERLRLRAGRGEPAGNEQFIEALFGDGHDWEKKVGGSGGRRHNGAMVFSRCWWCCGFCAVLWLTGCATTQTPRAVMGSPAMVAEAEALAVTLRADVTVLADEIGPRTVGHGPALAKAADWIEGQFSAAGWTVGRQRYEVAAGECWNLAAERRGTKFPDEVVVVGAHYDTVTNTPGADDNASGVAALLALARSFGPVATERTLRLVAFTNEEPEYFQTEQMGSLVYARACRARGERVVAMLSLEAMGYFSDVPKSQHYPFPLSLVYPSRGNFLGVVGNRESQPLVAQVAKRLRATGLVPVEAASLPGAIPGVGYSDHWSFWQAGYPAVMITDTALFRNPNYHEPTDKPATLDYGRLAATVQGLRVVVAELAGGELKP